MAANKRAKLMKLVLVEAFYIENAKIKAPGKNPMLYCSPDKYDLRDDAAGVYNLGDPYDKGQFEALVRSVRNDLLCLWSWKGKKKPLHEHIATLSDPKHPDYAEVCVRLEDEIVALRVRPLATAADPFVRPDYFAVDYQNPKTLRVAKKPSKKSAKKASA